MTLSELYKTDFEIKNIFAYKQTWTTGASFIMNHPRPQNGIIYLKNCEGVYTPKGESGFFAPKYSIVWLCEKSQYTCYNKKAGTDGTDAYLIQFNIEINGKRVIISDRPFLMNTVNNFAILSKMKEIYELTNSAHKSPAAIKGAAYTLISMLCNEYTGIPDKKYNSIFKGIEYLEKNPTSHTSIEDIAKMCNVSGGTFRRLFKEYSGKSPVSFRLEKQIELAQNMLISEYMTLSSICEKLEIDNVPYFCKLFLKKTGMTPSEYKNKYIMDAKKSGVYNPEQKIR